MSTLKKIAFTMYPAENLDRARSFYEKALELKPGKISAGGRWVEYDLPGGGCFVISDMVEGLKPSANSGGVAFEVDDLASLVATFAVVLDSEGNAVTLHQLKHA